ncbi:uncharacterized protein VP01_5141g2 [Puccinia sorghi]|uniref:Uncharacterized protein n=1 Tax=Puccinia sorghi TaxID=27349 RepID=A0A0L6ULR6_9BASI|nr:uncharacterized protein VP01_5141g2 [Puccinia sorghi]
MILPIVIPTAYYVPDLSNLLISLTHYIQDGYSVFPSFDGHTFKCRKGKQVLCRGTTEDKVLIIPPAKSLALATTIDLLVLHNSLGHSSLPYLKAAFPDLSIKELSCHHCDTRGSLLVSEVAAAEYMITRKAEAGQSKQRKVSSEL